MKKILDSMYAVYIIDINGISMPLTRSKNMATEKRYPSMLIQELDDMHAVYHLDLFTDEPIVEKPSPEVVSLLRSFIRQNTGVLG